MYVTSQLQNVAGACKSMLSKCWRLWSRKTHLPNSRESFTKKPLALGWSEAWVGSFCWREVLISIHVGQVGSACLTHIYVQISITVKCPYRWDFQILGSLIKLLLWMSGKFGQMAKTAGWPKHGGKICQTVFLRSLWAYIERSSRVMWAVEARGRGIIPGGPPRKVVAERQSFCWEIQAERWDKATAQLAETQKGEAAVKLRASKHGVFYPWGFFRQCWESVELATTQLMNS